ncbi:MAG TPA: AI-2E family transporter [Steroidobacteraceae bacterium]|nr:AI-2E family transporter [Steroidobacteraceae bacterium]
MAQLSDFYRRAFGFVTVLVLGYLLLKLLSPFLSALEWAAVLAFLLFPLQVSLSRKLAGRRGVSAAILTTATPFVIIAPLILVALAFAREVTSLISYLRTQADVDLSLPGMLTRLQQYPLLGPIVEWIRDNVPITMQQVQDSLTSAARSALESAAAISGSVALGVAGTLVDFVFMLFFLFFLLRDGRALLERLLRLAPLDAKRRDQLRHHVAAVMRAVVFGTAATAFIEGVLIGVGFAIVGLPSPVVFGVLSMIASFIPAVGTAVVLVPAVIYLAASGRWGAAVFLTVWSVAIAIAEQFLRPLLTARHGSVSTLAVFVGALGGAATFGFIGIILGPVLLSLIGVLFEMAEQGVRTER